MKMVLFNAARLIFISIIILSCEVTQKSHRAYIYNYKNDSVEIELPYVVKGIGNIHYLDLKRWKDFASDWIYISKLNSTVPADSLILIDRRRSFEFPYTHVNGKIILTNTTLTVDLMFPEYEKDSIVKWVRYELNGKYKWR